MKLDLYSEKMATTLRVSPRKVLTANESPDSDSIKNQTLSPERVILSADGLRKAREFNTQSTTEADDKLPPHIQRIKERITQLKVLIVEQKQKIVEFEQQSNMSEEVKKETLKLYQEQLSSLQFEKVAMMEMLQQALKDAGIEEPGALISAMMW